MSPFSDIYIDAICEEKVNILKAKMKIKKLKSMKRLRDKVEKERYGHVIKHR